MFKAKTKQKSNSFLKGNFVSEHSNFKSGSIVITNKSHLRKTFNNLKTVTEIGLPKENQQIRIVTKKAINSFDFILSIIHEQKTIDELYIAFYRIGKKTINELIELQERGAICKIVFLINDGFPKLVKDAYNLLKSKENENWTIKLENNHTKIILAKAQNEHYVIEGSGNLSINARIEQYVFDNDKKLYEFHKHWIDKI